MAYKSRGDLRETMGKISKTKAQKTQICHMQAFGRNNPNPNRIESCQSQRKQRTKIGTTPSNQNHS